MTSVQIASTRIAPVQVGLLSQPHHDGSALYVSNLSPEPGDTVTVRIRVPHEAGVVAVHVRTTPDGEPQFADAVVDRLDENETWWRAEIVCHNPVTCYRFVLEGRAMAYQWLNGTGLHLRDVPDAADFRIVTFEAPPAWAADAVVYQLFPDRFARAADRQDRPMPSWAVPAEWDAPVDLSHDGVARQLYGGDLDGVVEHLDHLQSLGVTVLYLTPFFPSRSNHRYAAALLPTSSARR